MKNRKIAIVALMLAAVLCIGVGYAAINSTIEAEGTITYSPEFAVEWGDVSDLGTTYPIVTDPTVDSNGKLTFTVNASDFTKDVPVTVVVPVVNNSKYAAENVAATITDDTNVEDYFTVTVAAGATTIAAGSNTTVVITITMTNFPLVDDAGYSETFTFELSADQDLTPAP